MSSKQSTLTASPPLNLSNNVLTLKSLLPPTNLVTGKFRMISEEPGSVKIQRYNDDGAIITDGWVDVVTFNFNTDTDSSSIVINSRDLLNELNNIYTKAQTDSKISIAISDLVASAPTTLNTLNEIAAALNNDPNLATTLTNQIASKQKINK